MVQRNFPRTQIKSQLPIPDDWDGETYTFALACIPDSTLWKAAFSGAVWSLTKGRAWDKSTGVIVDAQRVADEIFRSLDMNCGEQIAQALNNIAVAIQSSRNEVNVSCLCPEGTGTMPVEPSGEQPTEFGPDERWPNETVYLSDKCTVANIIWQDYLKVITDLNGYNVDNFVNVGIPTSIGIVGTIIAFGAMAPVVITVAVVSAIVAIFFAANGIELMNIINSLNTNKEDLICAMQESTNGDQAVLEFINVLDDGSLNTLELQLVNIITFTSLMNQLFTVPEDIISRTPDAPFDCSTCNPSNVNLEFNVINGVVAGSGDLSVNNAVRTLQGVYIAAQNRTYIDISVDGQFTACTNPLNWQVEIVSITPTLTDPPQNYSWLVGSECPSGNDIFNQYGNSAPDPVLGQAYNISRFAIAHPGNQPFSVELRISSI